MFLGTYLVSVTSGKRVSIPVVFREELSKKLVIAQWYEKCLVLTGTGSLRDLLTRMTASHGPVTQPIRKTEHFIFASSFEVEPDEQGRIVLPDKLMTYADIKDQVYFLGVGDRVELWSKQAWEKEEMEVSQDAANYLEDLAKTNV